MVEYDVYGFKNKKKVVWDKVPGRDKKWAAEQIRNLGIQGFNQEFACKFLGSTNTVISPECLRTLLTIHVDPKLFDLEDRLRVYEKPVAGAQYVLGVDPAKGTGEHFSCIQVLRIDSTIPVHLQQVAVFQDNLTDIYNFAAIINRLAIYYNNAYIMCENNGEGNAVIAQIWWQHENEGLVNSGSKEASLGVRSTRVTKPKAVLLMKKLIEDGSVTLVDRETIEQLAKEYNELYQKHHKREKFYAKYGFIN